MAGATVNDGRVTRTESNLAYGSSRAFCACFGTRCVNPSGGFARLQGLGFGAWLVCRLTRRIAASLALASWDAATRWASGISSTRSTGPARPRSALRRRCSSSCWQPYCACAVVRSFTLSTLRVDRSGRDCFKIGVFRARHQRKTGLSSVIGARRLPGSTELQWDCQPDSVQSSFSPAHLVPAGREPKLLLNKPPEIPIMGYSR